MDPESSLPSNNIALYYVDPESSLYDLNDEYNILMYIDFSY